MALNLDAITENAARLGQRLQETFSEHTRDLAIAKGSNSAYFDNPEEKLKNIRKQLDSSSDREKMEAMKRLIAVCSIQLSNGVRILTRVHSSFLAAVMSRSSSLKLSRTSRLIILRSANSSTSTYCAMQNKSQILHFCQSILFRKT